MTSNFNQWYKFISGPRKLKKLHEQCHKYETQIEHLEKTISELNTALLNKAAPDPRVAVLESIREFLALPIAVPAYLSERGRDYYILDVTEYRKQILRLIAAQRGEVEK